jgi:hypothetical protein
MKTKKYLLLLIGLMVFSACEDQLDIPQQGVLNMDTYYQTPQEAQEALAALYARWATAFTNNDYLTKTLLADELYTGGSGPADNADMAALSRAYYDATNGSIKTMYSGLYETIYRANLILDVFDANDPDPVIKQAVAEARFFRAWCYIDLVTLWGNPPLVTRVLSSDETKVPNTPAEETWAFIEAELTTAINSGALTEKQSATDQQAGVRPTKQTAQAYLGKAYLYQGKYEEAWDQLDAVIASNKYALAVDDGPYATFNMQTFSAENNSNPHAYVNLFHKEGNYSQEYLLSNNTVLDASNGYTNIWLFSILVNWNWANPYFTMPAIGDAPMDWAAAESFFGHYAAWYMPNVQSMQGYGFLNPRKAAYDVLAKIDNGQNGRRLTVSLLTHDQMVANKVYLHTPGQLFECEGYWRMKYLTRMSETLDFAVGWAGSAVNMPAMRYAEVLLMAAEAGFKAGKGAGTAGKTPLQLLNEVRTRAGAPTATALNMATIQEEFFAELCFEGHRFQDLQRWDKHGDIDMVDVLKDKGKQNVWFTVQAPSGSEPYSRTKTAFTNDSWTYIVPATEARAGFEAYEKLLPYPQTERDVNPNIVQNPGWEKVE